MQESGKDGTPDNPQTESNTSLGRTALVDSSTILHNLLKLSDTLVINQQQEVDVVANLLNMKIESTHYEEDNQTNYTHSYSDSSQSHSSSSSSSGGKSSDESTYSVRKKLDSSKRGSAYDYDSTTYTEEYNTRSRSSSAYEMDTMQCDITEGRNTKIIKVYGPRGRRKSSGPPPLTIPPQGIRQSYEPGRSRSGSSTRATNSDFDTSGALAIDWNERFQRQLEECFKITVNPQDELGRVATLRNICSNFAQAAKVTGVQIIHELYYQNKSIPPVTNKVGGIAGGEKYLHRGIFFKVAIDKSSLYESDEYAMKAGGHELKGMMSFLDCRVPHIHFPLVALIDYMGYRLVAQSVLPISAETLRYGSMDGAQTIFDKDEKLVAMMKQMAGRMNIQPHWVWSRDRSVRVCMYGPADMEGHLGADGRYYVVDTARLLPPTYPDGLRASYLFRLFRPEFLMRNPVPLSPDAFSKFGWDNAELFEQHVREATQRLKNEAVPAFTRDLDSRYKDAQLVDEWGSQVLSLLIAELHLHGINCRYLMHVYNHATQPVVKCMLLTETVSRVLKHLLCSRWRILRSSVDMDYISSAQEFFFLVFSAGKTSTTFWEEQLLLELECRFECTNKIIGYLREMVKLPVLFERLQEITGVSFVEPDSFYALVTGAAEPISPIVHARLRGQIQIIPRIKHTHQLSFQEGTALAKTASALAPRDRVGSYALFQQASRMFQECLATKPDDVYSLYNWGLSLSQQAKVAADEEESMQLIALASEKYARALRLQPNDYRALQKWGTDLLEQAQAASKAASASSDESQSRRYSDQARSLLIQAAEKLINSAKIQPSDFDTRYNCGAANLLLAKLSQDSKKQISTKSNKNSIDLLGHNKSLQKANNIPSPVASTTSWRGSYYPHYYDTLRYLKIACSELKAATELRPNHGAAWLNYGVAFAMNGRVSEAEEREELYEEAFAAYGKAQFLEPANPEILFNWGNALYRRAKLEKETTTGIARATPYLIEACKRYDATLRENNLFKDAFLNWSLAIELLANLTLITKAKEKEKERNKDQEKDKAGSSTSAEREKGKARLSTAIASVDETILRFLEVMEKEARMVCDNNTDIVVDVIAKAMGSLARTLGKDHDFHWLRLHPLAILSRYGNKPIESRSKDLLSKFAKCNNHKLSERAQQLMDPNNTIVEKLANKLTVFQRKSSSLKEFLGLKHGKSETDVLPGSRATLPVLSQASNLGVNRNVRTNTDPLTTSSLHRLSPIPSSKDSNDLSTKRFIYPLSHSQSEQANMTFAPKKLRSFCDVHMKRDSPLLYSHDGQSFDIENIVVLQNISPKWKLVLYNPTHKQYLLRQVSRDSHYAAVSPESMKRTDHPYIAKVRYVYQSATTISVLLGRELLDRRNRPMTVQRCLRDSDQPINDSNIRVAAAQISLALARFHDMGLSYWDFSSVHISGDGNICLTKHIGVYEIDEDNTTSWQYLAPEYLKDPTLEETPSKDWYAFGILLYELITGVRAFSSITKQQVLADPTLSFPANMQDDAKLLIKALTHIDPSKRLGSGPLDYVELRRHPFLKHLDWDDILHKRHFKHFPPFKEVLASCEEKERNMKSHLLSTRVAPERTNRYEGNYEFS